MRDGPGTGGRGDDGGLDGGGFMNVADCGVTGIWDGGRGKESRRRGTGVRRDDDDEDIMCGGDREVANEDEDGEWNVLVAVRGVLQPSSSLWTMVRATVGVAGVKERAKAGAGQLFGHENRPIWADHHFSHEHPRFYSVCTTWIELNGNHRKAILLLELCRRPL